MLVIAGGIMLGFIGLSIIGALGQNSEGEFSLGTLFGNVLALGFLALLLIAAVVAVIVVVAMLSH